MQERKHTSDTVHTAPAPELQGGLHNSIESGNADLSLLTHWAVRGKREMTYVHVLLKGSGGKPSRPLVLPSKAH